MPGCQVKPLVVPMVALVAMQKVTNDNVGCQGNLDIIILPVFCALNSFSQIEKTLEKQNQEK